MDIQLAVIADAANLSKEGKLNVLGEFDVIWAANVPVKWPLLHFVVKFKASTAEAHGDSFLFQIRIVDDDGQLAAPPAEFQTNIVSQPYPGQGHSGAIILGVQDAVFKDYGTYNFELAFQSARVCSVPLHVRPASDRPRS